MKNLLKAELYKQKLNGTLRMYILIMFLVGAVLGVSVIDKESWFNAYNMFMKNSMMVTMVMATLVALYSVGDFNDKSLHHAIMDRYSRKKIVLSKFLIYTIDVILGLLLYFSVAIAIIIAFSGEVNSGSYDFSITNYVIVTVLLKTLYLVTFNILCVVFCFLVRNSASFLLIILSMWATFIGQLSNFNFVKDNWVLRKLLKVIIMTQDNQIFESRIAQGVSVLTKGEVTPFVLIMFVTIILSYFFTTYVFSKVEIK